MPTPTPPYQFIAIARTIARGFTEQAATHPEGEALTEAAQAIWRGIEVLEGMGHRKRPDDALSVRSVRGRSPRHHPLRSHVTSLPIDSTRGGIPCKGHTAAGSTDRQSRGQPSRPRRNSGWPKPNDRRGAPGAAQGTRPTQASGICGTQRAIARLDDLPRMIFLEYSGKLHERIAGTIPGRNREWSVADLLGIGRNPRHRQRERSQARPP
jgi:hypothetical protein